MLSGFTCSMILRCASLMVPSVIYNPVLPGPRLIAVFSAY